MTILLDYCIRRGRLTVSLCAIITVLIYHAVIGDKLTYFHYDHLIRSRTHRSSSIPMVIVAIDDGSIDKIQHGSWPLPRRLHATVLREIDRGKPRLIVMSMLLNEPSSFGTRDDMLLALAIRRIACVVLSSEYLGEHNKMFAEPLGVFTKAALASPVINLPRDSDQYMRRTRLGWRYRVGPGIGKPKVGSAAYNVAGFKVAPSMGLALAQLYMTGRAEEIAAFGYRKRVLSRLITLDSDGYMPINYMGPSGSISSVSYVDVLRGHIDPAIFKDAIVFIEVTSRPNGNMGTTPFGNEYGKMSIGEIHANVCESICCGKIIKMALPYQKRVFLLMSFLFAVSLMPLFSSRTVVIAAGILLLAAYCVSRLLFATMICYWDPVYFCVWVVSVAISLLLFRRICP